MGIRSKKIRAKRYAKAILESNSMTEAYMKTHPNASKSTASKHSNNLYVEGLDMELEKILANSKPLEVTKDMLVKILQDGIQKWYEGKEKFSDVIQAVKIMSQLIPDFVTKQQVEMFSNMTDEELDKALKDLISKTEGK